LNPATLPCFDKEKLAFGVACWYKADVNDGARLKTSCIFFKEIEGVEWHE